MSTAADYLTAHERHLGAPIRSLADADAYRALGASAELRSTAGDCTDDEIAQWALGATTARVADAATDEDRARLAMWVREGSGVNH